MRQKSILIFMTLLLLTSCKPIAQDYVFTNSCDLPCWNGLISGSTTLEDSIKIIMNWSFTESISNPFTRSDGFNYVEVYIKNTDKSIEIAYLNNRIYYIYFDFELISFSQFQKAYGTPVEVGYGRYVSVDYFYRDDYIVYPEKGLALYVRGPQKSKINAQYTVQGMIISDPTTIFNVLKHINEDVDLEYSDWNE